jgi:hypothetical protein
MCPFVPRLSLDIIHRDTALGDIDKMRAVARTPPNFSTISRAGLSCDITPFSLLVLRGRAEGARMMRNCQQPNESATR